MATSLTQPEHTCGLGSLLGSATIHAKKPMMTDPTSLIKREVHQLVELQIQTLRQEAVLTSSELLDYHMRSDKITMLYQELDRIGRKGVELRLGRAF